MWLSSLFTLRIIDTMSFLLRSLKYIILWASSFGSQIRFLWGTLRILSSMFLFHVHVECRSRLIDEPTATLLYSAVGINQLIIASFSVVFVIVMQAECRFRTIVETTDSALEVFGLSIFRPRLYFYSPIFKPSNLMFPFKVKVQGWVAWVALATNFTIFIFRGKARIGLCVLDRWLVIDDLFLL